MSISNHNNNNNNNNNKELREPIFALNKGARAFILALTLLASGFVLISQTPMTAAFAQEENNRTTASETTTTNTIDGDADNDTNGSVHDAGSGGGGGNRNTTNTTAALSGIKLSPQPIFQDQVRGVSETRINQTHMLSTVSGNGTLTLPNTTEAIRTTSSGSLIISMKGSTAAAAGKEILTTEDGSENATAILYEIAQFNMQEGTGKGIAIAVVHTNSTGKLAPLDGMILAGQEEFLPDGSRLVTIWEWESGIPYVENLSDLTQESQMEATASELSPPSNVP
jgi:hypothetical protein